MSVTIIDNTKPFSPILTYKEKPDFNTQLDKVRYYQGEKQKWLDGVGEVAGTLYHKTQEQKIKHRNTGIIFRPECRDVDVMIHDEIKKSRVKGEALVIIKGRGIGLSCEMGCLANYFMRVFPGSTSLFTSAEQSKISALFSEKVMTTFNSYDEDIRPTVKRLNDTKNSVYLKAEVKSRDSDGKEYIADSEIFCKETADTDASASGFSGKGCIFGAYDEIYLHRRRSLLLKSSSSCYIDQATGKVIGFLLCGGSVEEVLTNEELLALQTLITDVEKSGRLGTLPARLLFIPAWWGKFMTNGHSDEKKAREWHEREVEQLGKLEDKSVLRAFRMNNPMSKDDIFDLSAGSFFDEDVMEKIKLQYDIVRKDTTIQEVPYIITKINDNLEAKPDSKGRFLILEHPKDRVDYMLTIDGIAVGTNMGMADGSKVASILWKMFDPEGFSYCPVGLYYERPKNVETSYIYSINLCHYYNKFGNFKRIEAEGNASTSDHLATFLEKEGLSKWIPYRNGKKKFLYVNGDVQDWQIKQMCIILRKYIGNVRMKSVLEDWLKPANVNADIRSSSLMFPIYTGADFDKPAVKTEPRKHIRPHIVMRNGASIRVWK